MTHGDQGWLPEWTYRFEFLPHITHPAGDSRAGYSSKRFLLFPMSPERVEGDVLPSGKPE
jgi:hypothetical protein